MTETGPLTNTILAGRYQLKDILGKGGMGTVYSAIHIELGRVMAVKVLHPHIVDNQSSLLRFKSEMKVMSALSHPNLIAISDAGVADDGSPFFVMEYIEGRSVNDELETGPIHPNRVLNIAKQVAEGLAHAHEKGIIHRDLKPANVMLIGRKDFVKVVDLGIAKMLTSDADGRQKLTQTGEVFGSPAYMSPEQCLSRSVDWRTDIYSLGCMIFEMITNAVPIQGATAIETIMLHINGAPFALSQVEGLVMTPTMIAFDEIIAKCLAKDPAARFQSMGDLLDALELVPPSEVTVTGSFDMSHPRANLSAAQPALAQSSPAHAAPAHSAPHSLRLSGDVGSDANVARFQNPNHDVFIQRPKAAEDKTQAKPSQTSVHPFFVPAVIGLVTVLFTLGAIVLYIMYSSGQAKMRASTETAAPSPGDVAAYIAKAKLAREGKHDNSLSNDMVRAANPPLELLMSDTPGASHTDVVSVIFGVPSDPTLSVASKDTVGEVVVNVQDPTPVNLFLYNVRPVHWTVRTVDQGKLSKIFLNSFVESKVDAPPNIKVLRAQLGRPPSDFAFVAVPVKMPHKDPRADSKNWDERMQQICGITGDSNVHRFYSCVEADTITLK